MTGRNIRNYRRVRDITQNELASRIGVTQGYLSHIETGRKKPSEWRIKLIADELKVSVEELTGQSKNELK